MGAGGKNNLFLSGNQRHHDGEEKEGKCLKGKSEKEDPKIVCPHLCLNPEPRSQREDAKQLNYIIIQKWIWFQKT